MNLSNFDYEAEFVGKKQYIFFKWKDVSILHSLFQPCFSFPLLKLKFFFLPGLADHLSRKYTLLMGGVTFFIGSILLAGAFHMA